MANNRYLTPKNETTVTRFVIAIVLYFLLRSIIKRGAKQATQDAILSGDNNALVAVEMRQAMNPSGTSWLMDFDGTDTDALFNSARKATDFPAVARAYANLYDADLLTDLQNELSPAQFAQFQALLGKGGATGKYYVSYPIADAFEVSGGDTDTPRISSTTPIKTYNQGEMIEGDFVSLVARASPTGNEYLLFKDSKFWFFETYFVIESKRLILK